MELTMAALRRNTERFDIHFLPTFAAAVDFACAQASATLGTGRTVVCFTETYKRFPLHIVGVSTRVRPVLVTIMGDKRCVWKHGHFVLDMGA